MDGRTSEAIATFVENTMLIMTARRACTSIEELLYEDLVLAANSSLLMIFGTPVV